MLLFKIHRREAYWTCIYFFRDEVYYRRAVKTSEVQRLGISSVLMEKTGNVGIRVCVKEGSCQSMVLWQMTGDVHRSCGLFLLPGMWAGAKTSTTGQDGIALSLSRLLTSTPAQALKMIIHCAVWELPVRENTHSFPLLPLQICKMKLYLHLYCNLKH